VIGSHIRWEAPLVNVRLRKAAKRGAKVFIVGPHWETTYPAEFLGDDAAVLGKLPAHVGDAMAKAERPAVIVGAGGLVAGALGPALALAESWKLVREGWNGFNVLHVAAARMGSLMLGFAQKGGMADLVAAKPKVVLALGADEVDYGPFEGALKVYIGHHGDKGAHAADVILPASAYTEKAGTYVNAEGRVQFADKAVFAPGDAREDWTILRALSDLIGKPLPFDRFDQLRAAMIADVPALGQDGIVDMPWAPPKLAAKASGPVAYPIKDFYLTNAICRASPTMRRCSEELVQGREYLEAAE
jgi:NADH-quinone oxidoreductase subunit G